MNSSSSLIGDSILNLKKELVPFNAKLVAVSKTKPVEMILEAMKAGQVDFGENYVQELDVKQKQISAPINWHFIGHLQTNKVKIIAPYVNLIHGVENMKALEVISRQSLALEREIEVLLQIHIAKEETKFGFGMEEVMKVVSDLFENPLPSLKLTGFMGMATFTNDEQLIRNEFRSLRKLFESVKNEFEIRGVAGFDTLSMGMTSDYKIALEEGSTMVRIGSAIFGSR
ncbi:MAG: YggS family pyridoxal phosphate-dependent enzyme [Bacteroidetes bacterium]|nr:YggS family pyridoxal phosphate-dependent enzyme [Bacteroidota bacterium]